MRSIRKPKPIQFTGTKLRDAVRVNICFYSMCVNKHKFDIYFVKQFQRLAELSKTITVSAKWLCKYIIIILKKCHSTI